METIAQQHKRYRRTNAVRAKLRSQLYNIVAEHKPLTVQQAHVHIAAIDLVTPDRLGYQMISSLLTDMRRKGEVPCEWIVGDTRMRPQATNAA